MRGVAAGFGIVAIGLISLQLGQVGAQDDPSKPEYYTTKVKPILDANCARCHMGENHRGGLNIDTHEGLLKGGHDGPVIVPGDPTKSLLIKLIRHEGPADDPMPMPPPPRAKLSDADIATVTTWIRGGAVMPPSKP
jgi:cytochrome c